MHCYLIWISSSWPWAGRGEERREGVGGFFFQINVVSCELECNFHGERFLRTTKFYYIIVYSLRKCTIMFVSNGLTYVHVLP